MVELTASRHWFVHNRVAHSNLGTMVLVRTVADHKEQRSHSSGFVTATAFQATQTHSF